MHMVLTAGLTFLFQTSNIPTNLCNVWWSIWRHKRLLKYLKMWNNWTSLKWYSVVFGFRNKMKINFYFVLNFTISIVNIWFSSLYLSSKWSQLVLKEVYKKIDSSKATWPLSSKEKQDVKIQFIHIEGHPK